MKKTFATILLLLAVSFYTFSQSSLDVKLMFLSMHPVKSMRQPDTKIYENSIDENGNLIKCPGIIFEYNKYFHLTTWSVQFTQGIFVDAIANLTGFTHILLDYKLYHKKKFAINIGLGPGLSYRQDWHNSYRYVENDGYTVNGKFQTKWFLASELDINYYISNKFDVNISLLAGHEYGTLSINLGVRYWVSSIVNFKDCNTCKNKYRRGGGFKLW
jgi:hypothetical protein